MGGLMAAIGLILLLGGGMVSRAGHLGAARYQKPSGKFIRALSAEDQAYFRKLKTAVNLGRAVQAAGWLVIFSGLAVVTRPKLLFGLLKRAGIRDESPKGASSRTDY